MNQTQAKFWSEVIPELFGDRELIVVDNIPGYRLKIEKGIVIERVRAVHYSDDDWTISIDTNEGIYTSNEFVRAKPDEYSVHCLLTAGSGDQVERVFALPDKRGRGDLHTLFTNAMHASWRIQ